MVATIQPVLWDPGIIKEGLISDSIGTSGVVFASSDKPLYDEDGRIHCWCHSVPSKWLLVAATLSAAGSLKWYYDTFGPTDKIKEIYPDLSKYQLFDKQAENVPIGSEGLIFLPYLSGERYLSGVRHIAFTVKDVKKHEEILIKNGVKILLNTTEIPDFKTRVILFYDPDGLVLEFCEDL